MNKNEKNELFIDNSSIIENTTSKRGKKTLSIDGYILTQKDVLNFKCQECGKEARQRFLYHERFTNHNFICEKCQSKHTMKKNHGVEHALQSKEIMSKVRQTMEKKYGGYALQSKEIMSKTVETNLGKYGVENVYQAKEIKEKIKEKNLEKYGFKYISQNRNIKKIVTINRLTGSYNNIIKRTKNNVKPLFSAEEYRRKGGAGYYTLFNWECKTCGTSFKHHINNGVIPRCPTCFPKLSGHSNQEKEIVEWLTFLGYSIIENDRMIIGPKELDIYLPDYKLAIEYNGIYWHSDIHIEKSYHQDKVKMCHDKGIRLLHIWEDEWLINPEKIKEKILYYVENLNKEIKPVTPKLKEVNGWTIWI